ncbi:MAG: metallophosphoesterase [Lachnospiraceae bacterium]|jgi:hypothetical protein|nr:metallophosphoesterase [Lachnospiraceae bacterium]
MKILIAIILCLFAACIVNIVVDSNRFVVRRYEVNTDKIDKTVHFVFVSDLHNKVYGTENSTLLRAIDELQPQFILCGGDIPTANPGQSVDKAANFMQKLAEKYRIYYANGNHEQRMQLYPDKYGSMHEDYEKALQKAGISRMINRTESRGEKIRIHGLELDRKFYRRFHTNTPEKEEIEALFREPLTGDGNYHILLAHNPEFFDVYAQTGVDLVLSGHVHGGIARLPFLGGVISPSLHLFPKYDGGFFEKGNCRMIISRGLGSHTIPLRFLNPAELVDVVIKSDNLRKEENGLCS